MDSAPNRDHVVTILQCLHRVQRELLAGADVLLDEAGENTQRGDRPAAVSELNVVHAYLTLYLRTDASIGILRQFDLAAFPFESLLSQPGSDECIQEVASWGVGRGPTSSEAEEVWKRYDAIFRSLRATEPHVAPPLPRGIAGGLQP